MTIRVLGLALCLAVLASACASGGGAPAGGGDQVGPQLDGRTFLSTEVTENGAPRQLVDGTQIRFRFDEGRLNADAGCNQLSGEYTVEGTALAVGQLAMTEMACMPAARMEQDTWLAELLGSRPTVVLTGDTLVLTGGSIEITLLDRAVADADRALVGPRWLVDTIGKGDVVFSISGDTEAYFTFTADGRVSGNTGCNQFNGAYDATTDTITFSQVAMTKKACPGAVDVQERAVTVMFEGRPVAYRIEANQMTLTYADGSGGLRLRAP